MKTRWTIVGLAAGALALGLIAPVTASGAPVADPAGVPAADKPQGEALVYVAGGAARAKKIGHLRYRITVPPGSQISWLGMRDGEGHVGTFTPKALVAAWKGMGYRDGVKAIATLTWGDTSEKRDGYHALAILKAPQLTAEGNLVFRVRTIKRELPRTLKYLDVHVNRATALAPVPTSRGVVADPAPVDDTWTTTFAPVAIDANATAWVQAIVSNDSVADVVWPATIDPNPCRTPVETSTDHQTTVFPGFPCGDGTVNSHYPIPMGREEIMVDLDSEVQFQATTQAYDGVTGEVYIELGYTPTGGGEFYFAQIIALWDRRGQNLMAEIPS
ncbi:MAG: hypothetical protein ACKOT0_03440 [bacterium]